jgi:transposase-like protein
MPRLPCTIVQLDEIWTYVGKHERFVRPEENPVEVGDQYVFVAMDSETKLIPSFCVGKRNFTNTWHFVQDLQQRLANRAQITTDGFRPYVNRKTDDGSKRPTGRVSNHHRVLGQSSCRFAPVRRGFGRAPKRATIGETAQEAARDRWLILRRMLLRSPKRLG